MIQENNSNMILPSEKNSSNPLTIEIFKKKTIIVNLNYGSFYIPKQKSFKPRGEDAHFICDAENAFGVADGVGSWADKGIDAGEYARLLMENCASTVSSETKGIFPLHPKRILTKAYLRTNVPGSSTACVVALRDNVLHVANVGDSGIVVFREKKVVFVSETQQNYFNCPYQLKKPVKSCGDLPVKAWEGKVRVFVGDVVVVGTDGLWDNVEKSEIEKVLMEEETVQPERLARKIAELAFEKSLNTRGTTPFATAARRAGILHEGGKVDDITVVVGYVTTKS